MSEGWRGEDTFVRWRDAVIAALPPEVTTDETELAHYWEENALKAPGPLGLGMWFYIKRTDRGWSTIFAKQFVDAYYPFKSEVKKDA